MKHYFLFGKSAVEIYDENGIEFLVERTADEYISGAVYVFENGVDHPAALLAAFNGYGDYSCITEEEYEMLKDCF